MELVKSTKFIYLDSMKILFATQNKNKVEEVRELLPEGFEILTLEHFNFRGEIPENQTTIEGNAIQKVNFVFDLLRTDCFAEDTGLIVPSLGGEPGVYSARYAGPERAPLKNMEKLLATMTDKDSREAYFETVIALKFSNRLETFVGRCHGHISQSACGKHGFGYDPIFIPLGFNETLAQLPISIKSQISHRAKAMAKLISFLRENCALKDVAQ